MLLNYAGVIFYELGAVKAATALFSAAQRLDPELPNVERNLSECTRRRRKGVRVVPRPPGPCASCSRASTASPPPRARPRA